MKDICRAALAVILIASCHQAGAAEEVRFRVKSDPATLDWNLAHSSDETYILMNIMEGLVRENENLRPEGALAETWAVSKDRLTYTFQLRRGVLWSDGQELIAKHFVDSWKRLLSPETNSSYREFLHVIRGAKGGKPAIESKGRYELKITLEKPLPHFPNMLGFWVTFPIRLDLIRKHGNRWSRPDRLVTLGPYRVKKWTSGEEIRLIRYKSYYQKLEGAPLEVQARIVSDDSKARELFKKGELDFLLDPRTQDLLTKGSRAKGYPYLATYYLGFNVSKGALRDSRIRKAIAQATDRNKLPETLQSGQKAAGGWIPPGVMGHQEEGGIPFDLYQARGNLVKSGYPEAKGLKLLSLWCARFDGAKRLAEMIQSLWKQNLGIQVKIQYASPSEITKAMRRGKVDLFIRHWGADFADPASFYDLFLSSSGNNPNGYKNVQYDSMVNRARHSSNAEERKRQYRAAEKELLLKDVAVVPLFYQKKYVLLGKRVRELELSPLNYLFFSKIRL